jgi:hypothetical protein
MLVKILLFPVKLILRLTALILGAAVFCVAKVLTLVLGILGVICRFLGVVEAIGAMILTGMFISARSDPATPPDSAAAALEWWHLAMMYGGAALIFFLPDITAMILGVIFGFSEILISFGVHGRITAADNDYESTDVAPMPAYKNADLPIVRFSKIHDDFTKESAAFSGTFNALLEGNERTEFTERAEELTEEYNTIIDRFNEATEEIQNVSGDGAMREISADAKYQLNKLRDLHDRVRRLSRRPARISAASEPPQKSETGGFNPFAGVKNAAELKKRYAKLCQAYHPDVSGTESTEQMQYINAEYERLQKEFS